jgi:hypothetical protein
MLQTSDYKNVHVRVAEPGLLDERISESTWICETRKLN